MNKWKTNLRAVFLAYDRMRRVGPFDFVTDKLLGCAVRCGHRRIVILEIRLHARIEIAQSNPPSAIGQRGREVKQWLKIHIVDYIPGGLG